MSLNPSSEKGLKVNRIFEVVLYLPKFVQVRRSKINQDEEAEGSLYIIFAFIGFVIAILFSLFWSVTMGALFFFQMDTSYFDDISDSDDGTDTSSAAAVNAYLAEDADDAANDAAGGADTLIRMQMTGKDDLAWSFVKVTLSVGDNVYTCNVVSGDACTITQSAGSDDNAWEPGEYIFLSEGTAEICSASGCNVGISVTNGGHTVAGDTSQMVD